MDILTLLSLVTSLDPSAVATAARRRRGIASVYYNGKDGKLAGGGLACLWGHPKGQHVDPSLRFVAHRSLPCGTVVKVTSPRTKRSTLAVVIDRGPFGALHKGRWRIKVRASDPGVWRGELDLSPGTAKAIGHNGFEIVDFRVVGGLRGSAGPAGTAAPP
jgi:hypothetical protein